MKFAAATLIAFALCPGAYAAEPDCNHYINASMKGDGGEQLIFADGESIDDGAHFVEREADYNMMTCVTYHVPGANGGDIIPTRCKQAETHKRIDAGELHWFYPPTADGQAVLYFDGAVWYAACATDLLPYDGTDAFPTRRPPVSK